MKNLSLLILFLATAMYSFAQVCPSGTSAPKALIAGDSWAQYMADDGTYNLVFDKFGHGDKLLLGQSLGSDPGPGYAGPEYAISGSEADQWSDEANFPWIANVVAELNANPTIETVVLSIGGNDILAGRSGGGWYQDMDVDVPGSEQALFDVIKANTEEIIDASLAVRPEIEVLLSSYDYPNFNTGFFCAFYACPKRRDLSYSDTSPLIDDAGINQMMVLVEQQRIDQTNNLDQVYFDNAIGLMHYYYGDGNSGPGVLAKPGQVAPSYIPFPGGNPALPSLNGNFRSAADPIHLDAEGYYYKISEQMMSYFFPKFRGDVNLTFFSEGGANDGWVNGNTLGTDGIYMGDNGVNQDYKNILSFNTDAIPDGAIITSASLYIVRDNLIGTNPFSSGALGSPMLDVVNGTFGSEALEISDATAGASVIDAACAHGSLAANDYALRMDLNVDGVGAINKEGKTQLRLYFPSSDPNQDVVIFNDGDATVDNILTTIGLEEFMNDARPFLDISYTLPLAVELLKFDGKPEIGFNQLYWLSQQEEGLVQYELEQSLNAQHWGKIGEVKAANQPGQNQYEFAHRNPFQGINYYRLKMIYENGDFDYSEVVALKYQKEQNAALVYPNPFKDEFNLRIDTEFTQDYELLLHDLDGRLVHATKIELAAGGANVRVKPSVDLKSGVYILSLRSGSATKTYRIAKY